MKILVVDDEQDICEILQYNLETEGYEVVTANSAEEALELPLLEYGLILLDVMMDEMSGFQMARKMKDNPATAPIPIIFITALEGEDNMVKGLNIGADDYITKPFSTKELLARMNKILMRTRRSTAVTVSDITFDLDKMVVYRGDQRVELSALELKILSLLFLSLNKVVTRNTILDKIWEWTGNFVEDHTVTVYLGRIREKIGADIIITVKGMGYRIDEQ